VSALSGVALVVPGAILLRRDPRHPVAWVLCLTGVHWSVDSAAASWLVHATQVDPALAGASVAFWVSSASVPRCCSRCRSCCCWILDLVAAGRSNPQIAAALYLSPKTVRNNVSNVFAKLRVADRAEAIVRAREAGLG
jgi:hypothetical protein